MRFLLLLALFVPFAFELDSGVHPDVDIVRSHYDTYDELMADGGVWLPGHLPGSTHDIETTSNPGLNHSRGGFEFIDTDAGAFFAQLTLGAPAHSPFDDWEGIVRDHQASGHVAWTYRERHIVWTFFCHPVRDECDYLMWVDGYRRSVTPGTAHSDAAARTTPIAVAASTSLG